MIQLSNIQVLRGGRALLEGHLRLSILSTKLAWLGDGCGKSTLFALLRDD